MKLIILLFSFYLTLESLKLPKYGSLSFYGSENIYLQLDGFNSGQNVIFHLNSTNSQCSIQYRESNSFSDSEFINYSFLSLSSYSRVTINDKLSIDFTIKLTGNYNYLLLKVTGNPYWFTISNKENSTYTSDKGNTNEDISSSELKKAFKSTFFVLILMICIPVFIIIIVITLIICCLCKSRSGPDYASRIDSPLIPSYPGVQPQPQPIIYTQPGYQPYVVQQGYH
jgi:hypothetical protein